jgi:hypothetical protein
MTPIPINIATEDELSELVLSKLLAKAGRFALGICYRKGGFGYLRNTIHGWNRAAKGIPFLLLTDLDTTPCPSALIEDWLHVPKHPNLLFRVAVREVESWLLADSENFAKFLGLKPSRIPTATDEIPDPKAALVELARHSRFGHVRDAIVPRRGSTAKQGPDYNGCLGRFIRENWNIRAASVNSPSLARTMDRIAAFNPIWPSKSH